MNIRDAVIFLSHDFKEVRDKILRGFIIKVVVTEGMSLQRDSM